MSHFYLWKLIIKEEFDLVHYFGYPGAILAPLHAWKVPYLVSLRGVDVPGYNQKFGWYYKIYQPLSKLAWKLAKKVITNSQGLKSLAKKTLDSKSIEVIPNGVDTELFRPLPLSSKESRFSVTAGGTLMNNKKGLDLLIQGFHLFVQEAETDDVQLVLYGSGPKEQELRALVTELGIESLVEFRGRVPHQKLAEELPRNHLFCLPSKNEGMSNAMLEAAASGLPLVVTDVGGAKELVSNDNGTILDERSPISIAQALAKYYKNQEQLQIAGKNSRQVAEKMSWERVAKQYVQLYK